MGSSKKLIIDRFIKDFKFKKYIINSETVNSIEVYIKHNKDYDLCVNFSSLSTYLSVNREISNLFLSKNKKNVIINIFMVKSLEDVDDTYFRSEFYEEAIFIEEDTNKIKSYNISSVGVLNVIKDILDKSKKRKLTGKNNYVTMSLIFISLVVYFMLSSVSSNFVTINDDVLLWAGGKMDILIREGEFMRIFTSVFLHKNFMQLVLSVITLFFTGSIVEKNLSKIHYLLLIIFSAFFGNFVSYIFNFSNVFGVGLYVVNFATMGGMFILAIKNKNRVNKHFFIFLFSFIVVNLFSSFVFKNMDNLASLTSFIFGIIFVSGANLKKTN